MMKNNVKDTYDLVIITNLPAFYKLNLFNILSKKLRVFIIFVSRKSTIREKDFSDCGIDFEHVFITDKNYEDRNKLISLLKVCNVLNKIDYKVLLYPGWELVELIPLILIHPKSKNGMVIESSILETRTTGFLWWIKKYLIGCMSVVFPSGQLQLEILSKAKYSGKVRITHGVGIPNRDVAREVNEINKNNDFKYLYVGRLSQEKNLDFLVNRFNINGKHLTIVGNGDLFESLKINSKPNVNFTGYINNRELVDVYKSHHIFILPSCSEPWGLVIDEALWFGLPVVVSCNVGCSEDLVVKPRTGVVFKLDNIGSFDNSLADVESNYAIYKSNVEKINFNQRDQEQIDSYLYPDYP